MTESDQGEFWADNVQRLKKEGPSAQVIRECAKKIPYPAAFREIAIAIRKNIRARRNENANLKDLLRKLYKWAVIENFFIGIEWNKVVTERILHSTARSCIKGIKAPYGSIGYENLALLNKTDAKWLVEAFGEPEMHGTARDANPELWEKAVETFRAGEQRDEQQFWRSHGFDRPPDESKLAPRSEKPPSQSKGCMLVIAAGLGTVVSVIWIMAL